MNFFTSLRRTRFYKGSVNKHSPKRLNWEQIENIPRQEGRKVVKGTSKRVVVVKSPDPKFFEQAIFILREDIRGKGTERGGDVLREAQRVADDYVRDYVSEPRKIFSNMPPMFFSVLGAAAGIMASIIIFNVL